MRSTQWGLTPLADEAPRRAVLDPARVGRLRVTGDMGEPTG